MRRFIGVLLLAMFSAALAAGEEPIVIPVLTDPSPVIDGNLQEWANRGALREMTSRKNVTFAPQYWKGPADLSGWVRLGYDDKNLYVACHVVDDVFVQDQSGTEAWRGDHVMLTVDFVRSGNMRDVMQTGLSPGNLRAPAGQGPPTPPEFIIWEPQGARPEGAIVAARRTSDGYDLEAAIPWKVFGITPVQYQVFGIEVAFSDCDSSPTRQEKAISIGTSPWKARDPARLILAGLADRAGNLPAEVLAEATTLAKEFRLKHAESREFAVRVERIPKDRVPTLTFKARVQWERPAGCCGPLAIAVNGNGLSPTNIAERPPVVTFMNGGTQTTWYGAGVTLWYGPSFDAIEKSAYKPIETVSYDYILRLDGLIHEGENRLIFANADARPEIEIVVADLAFGWLPPSRFQPPKEWAPAPTGPLPVHEPSPIRRVQYDASPTEGGAIALSWAGRRLVFESRYSVPGGGWLELTERQMRGWRRLAMPAASAEREVPVCAAESGGLELVRTLIAHDECVEVRDVLVNRSGEERPLIIRHRTAPGPYEELWLCGRPVPMNSGASAVAENPSVVVLAKDNGFAMMAYDDVFRIHYSGSCDKAAAEISDQSLVLRPGIEYRHQWLVFPLERPDYWCFVNAARRFLGTNFPIEGSFCFFHLHPVDVPLTKEEIGPYLERKNALFVSVGLMQNYKGLFPHGPVERTLDPSKRIALNKMIREVRPQSRILHYFNTFDCARAPDDPVQWTDSRILLPDGQQVHNGAPYPLYFVTLTNSYGKEMDAIVEWLLNVNGADGLYWDCYQYATVDHYGEPWDGWTGSIDPETHVLRQKRSSTTLITWPWRERLTARLLSEGRPLVANGNPVLTSEYRYRFPRFVETADISALSRAHLFTPIALGDHITERNETDSYRWMLRALDWGGLYYWYSAMIIPTHHTLTSYMFPFTPIELHQGWLIGEERILTKVSGLFGWGDASDFETHIFDRVGKETTEIGAPRIVRDGRTYVELRLPEGYSAAVVRRPPQRGPER